MKIVIKLNKSNGDRGNGYEIVVYCNHLRNRKQKVIGYSKIDHFNDEMQLVNEKHPDYEELLPRLMDIKLKARKIIASGVIDVETALQKLFAEPVSDISFIKWCEDYVNYLKINAEAANEKGDLVRRNRINGNYRANLNSLNQFKKFYPKLSFSEVDYNKLLKFRQHYENVGGRAKTILHYIGHLKSMYNKGIRKYNLEDTQPFKGILDNLTLRSFDAKKKYIDIADVKKLEDYLPQGAFKKQQQLYVDVWLLQFYFGGCDLTDLYFMNCKALFKNRVLIERGKTEQVANLIVHPKAKAIIEKYKIDTDDWLFPWKKDIKAYETFRSTYYKSLSRIQKRLNINVLPTGGAISVKVARHTFGNRAKQLMIDADIIRELMAHERNDVDNFYKDKFSEKVRDEALFKIIDTDSI